MSTQLAARPMGGQIVTAEQAKAIRTALKSSLYPGASDDSVEMVLAYCQAAGLDPMTKPVHIVPIWLPEKKDGNRTVRPAGMQDVVMPGIELYRTKAHRTGEYAGQDECEFGPTVTTKLSGVDVRYPEWCRVTVYRQTGGQRVPYSAKVYWLESYATAKCDTDAPNAMWKKRPFGQLEKCAEAMALRKAFPEAVGAQPTAEEMEGKALDISIAQEPSKPAYSERQLPPPEEPDAVSADGPNAALQDGATATTSAAADAQESGPTINDGQIRMLTTTLDRRGVAVAELLTHFKIDTVESLPLSRINEAMDWIKSRG